MSDDRVDLPRYGDGSLPNHVQLRGRDLVSVYRSSDWKTYDELPADEKGGWPWMSDGTDLETMLVLYDPDTGSFCVVIDDA